MKNPGKAAFASVMFSALVFAGSILLDPVRLWSAPSPDLPRHALVFAHHSDAHRDDYDLARICSDGTQMASLVVLPGHQLQLAVRPDGEQLVYSSKHDGEYELWSRPFLGGEPTNLTDNPASDQSPVWSPDGKELAFFSDRDTEKLELYIMNMDNRAVRRVTENTFYDSGASWAPDANTIVFTRFFPGDDSAGVASAGEIFEIDPVTGKERQLTHLGGYNGGPDHSPDGRLIAFHRVAEAGAEIWIMNADGSNQRQVTDTFVDEYSPAWSPDGDWIAIAAGTENDSRGTFDLWLMRPDGTGRRPITLSANTEMGPEWRKGEHFCR